MVGKTPELNSVAIMQPYLFPYIGYFQLVASSDCFVFLDDVTFIKSGWINRNYILMNGSPFRFTFPLAGISSNVLIRDLQLFDFSEQSKLFMKHIKYAYGKSYFFSSGMSYIELVLATSPKTINELAQASITCFFNWIGLKKEFLSTSNHFIEKSNMKGEDRIIDICKRLTCNVYINPEGGRELYSQSKFQERGVTLRFLHSNLDSRLALSPQNIRGYSIIHLAMNLSKKNILSQLLEYKILK